MNARDARRLLLLRAIEDETDGDASVAAARERLPWSAGDATWAGEEARRQLADADGAATSLPERWLVLRARVALQRLSERLRGLDDLSDTRGLPGDAAARAATVLLVVAAFALGLLGHAVGPDGRFDLLALPLTGVIAWNLAVYAALAVAALRPGRSAAPFGPFGRAWQAGFARLAAWPAKAPGADGQDALRTLRRHAAARWWQAGAGLQAARAGVALHLAAAALAAGALAGLYLRGLVFAYRASWDSTFLDAGAVHALLSTVLGPASRLAGIALPDVATLQALRASAGPGGDAAPWIHLWSLTALGLVVLPRLLLAAAAAWRASRLRRHFPLPLDGAYFRRLLRERPPASDAAADAGATGHAGTSPAASNPAPTAATIALSLVSHTNVGKTTLARTLLRRDVGEVRDAEHVTLSAERHLLVDTPEGDRLELWDTPGFADSERMARRLAQAGQPIGWFLGEVWDRVRDRAFWLNQRALRHVLERADVVLYLVDASEREEALPTLAAELRVLALIGKPVVVLLNQLGPPREAAREAAERARWQARLAPHPCVREVLAFDAFARCWISEGTLLRAIETCVPDDRRAAFRRLDAAWTARNRAVWHAAMDELGRRLARAACDRQAVPDAGLADRVRALGSALGLRREAAGPREQAMQALAARLDADLQLSTGRLIALHGLDGRAGERVLRLLAEHYAARQPVDESRAAVLGGLLTGALAGLKADLATGGLSLGGGLLVGGVLGALGAAGMARGVNLLRGIERPTLAWTDAVLDELARAAVLGYLAVAHHGRGRGAWQEADHPAWWADAVDAALAPERERLHALWAEGRRDGAGDVSGGPGPASAGATPEARLATRITGCLTPLVGALLLRLHPEARPEDARSAAPGGPA